MGRVICIGNHKGGVGKSTTAINLSAALAIAEKRTLLIDSDPQGHSTTGMGIDKGLIKKSLYNGLRGDALIDELILKGDIDYLKIIPSRLELVRSETELLSRDDKEKVLKGLIKTQKDNYDYILIDCPPSLNLLTVNALTASDSMVVPLQCEFFAREGLKQFIRIYEVFKRMFNPDLRIEGILLTMVDRGDACCEKIAEETKIGFNGAVFNTSIPRDKNLIEAARFGRPILFHDITSPGARSYMALAKEIMTGTTT